MANAPRRTKIIATIGPASQEADVLKEMFAAGVDLVRVNFSHGNHKEQQHLIRIAREAASALKKEIGIIADLQGPKIRVGSFENGMVKLTKGQHFTLDCDRKTLGDKDGVGTDYLKLYQDVSKGDVLLLDDGLIEMNVTEVVDKKILCKVTVPGVLSDHKGVNRYGNSLTASALTDKDMLDLQVALDAGVDYIAVSFIRSADDIVKARQRIKEAGGQAAIIAKIESADALDDIDSIIKSSDAVMVARGDLGVEIGLAEVPFEQKRIIHQARELNRAVITATQMMESMIHQPQATRAEVSDVANAVVDGTDAVMFSAETAVGKYPVKVVETVDLVCKSAEKHRATSGHRLESQFERTDEAIAMATMYTANHYPIKAIIALTETGASTLWMSRIRSNIPIYALTRHLTSHRKINLYRGVFPISFDPTQYTDETIEKAAIDCIMHQDLVHKGDKVILTKGSQIGNTGGTDSLKIVTI